MRRNLKKKEQSIARRAAETALDVAVGGTALAADKAIEAVDKVVGRAEEAAEAVEEGDTRTYENRTLDELYELAADRDIEGRSSMRKAELITALRAER